MPTFLLLYAPLFFALISVDQEPASPNALIHEPSPYLQQHAYNPVDWMPWGEAAFARAKERDKAIFCRSAILPVTGVA